jgi:hypothetical protein
MNEIALLHDAGPEPTPLTPATLDTARAALLAEIEAATSALAPVPGEHREPATVLAARQLVTDSHERRPLARRRPVRSGGSRKRTAGLLGVAATVVVGGGVGAAAAGGLMPQAFIDAFSAPWQTAPAEGNPSVDPATAERVATAAGPDGRVFTVMAAVAADNPDFTCTVALFETPESAAMPGPAAFVDGSSNWCQDGPETLPFGSGANIDVFQGYYVWNAPASDAVRGELRTPSGETYPVVSSAGRLWGWFPARVEGEPQAELIGYAADGTEIGREAV